MSDFGGRIPTTRKEKGDWWDLLDEDLKVTRKKKNFYHQDGEWHKGDSHERLGQEIDDDDNLEDWIEI